MAEVVVVAVVVVVVLLLLLLLAFDNNGGTVVSGSEDLATTLPLFGSTKTHPTRSPTDCAA